MLAKLRLNERQLIYLDLAGIVFSTLSSYLLRLEFTQVLRDYIPTVLITIAFGLIIKVIVYRKMGLYRRAWAYASMRELRQIITAVTVGALLTTAAVLTYHYLFPLDYFARSVFIIDWLTSILTVGAVRYGLRMQSESARTGNSKASQSDKTVLIIGAGDAGALVVRELIKNPQVALNPIGFLDDDPAKRSLEIHGIPVVGQISDLEDALQRNPVDEVIVAIPSAPGSIVRTVAEVCTRHKTAFRTMPGIYELLGGQVSVNRLREVDITDLLRREPAPINRSKVQAAIHGKRILITGAGGSIASELCRQLAGWEPSEIILVGHGENSIFSILVELHTTFPEITFHPLIADVRNKKRLTQIFEQYKPEMVFHAAAHKHVPLMEINVVEAITNNILGTKNVVETAAAHNINQLVMISTDKAVQPTSVMGGTKRIAEMIVLDAAARHNKAFSIVRFGNVLGSRGSVVPHFKRQIARSAPVTVTHPDIERYFMTIPEAVHLVLQASTMGRGGEMFVLDMGEPVKIVNLAEDLIRLSGLEPGEDIEIIYTGLRPGEKLYEELWYEGADYKPTEHPSIIRLNEKTALNETSLENAVENLLKSADEGASDAIIQQLDAIIPGASIQSTPSPDLDTLI